MCRSFWGSISDKIYVGYFQLLWTHKMKRYSHCTGIFVLVFAMCLAVPDVQSSCGICWRLGRYMSASYSYLHLPSMLKLLKSSGIWVSETVCMLLKILCFSATKQQNHKTDYYLTGLYCTILFSVNFRFRMPLIVLFNISLLQLKSLVLISLWFPVSRWWQLTLFLCIF